MTGPAVSISQVTMQFGGLRAVNDVSLDIAAGERHVLLGPNGAGKSTLFNMIGGQLCPTAGRIALFGQEVAGAPPHRRAHAGLGRTFQITSLFPHMTVEENLHLAIRALSPTRFGMIRGARASAEIWARVSEILADWRFSGSRASLVSGLSYGDQRKLEIAMAVANAPRLLLLDEPTSGLSASETENVVALIKGLSRAVTVIVVEHDMDVAFEIADRFTILQDGRLVLSGTADQVRGNAELQRIYFGDSE